MDFFALFPHSKPLLMAEMDSKMSFTLVTGSHPEVVKRRALRGLPVATCQGTVLYIIFTKIAKQFVILHASISPPNAQVMGTGESTIRPPISPAAWDLAQTRFSEGLY